MVRVMGLMGGYADVHRTAAIKAVKPTFRLAHSVLKEKAASPAGYVVRSGNFTFIQRLPSEPPHW